jgi:hypothetical protein
MANTTRTFGAAGRTAVMLLRVLTTASTAQMVRLCSFKISQPLEQPVMREKIALLSMITGALTLPSQLKLAIQVEAGHMDVTACAL